MAKKRILAIDDCRELGSAHVLCRTYHDGTAALKFLGPWDELLLDHDLGRLERQETDSGEELTGYKVLCFLEENPQYLPGKITIVSSNPVGRLRMQELIKKLYP